MIGIIVLIGGPAVASAILFSTIFSSIDSMAAEIPSIQVVVPGSSDITLTQSGKYTVFYEYQSMVGNRIYSTGEDIPDIQVNLVSNDTGAEIPLSSASVTSTYTIGSRSGIGLFDFVIDQPGAYELSASYPAVLGQQQEQGPEIVLAIIHGSAVEKLFGSIMGTVAGALAIVFIPFVAGVAIIIITFIKRRKARARARSTA